MFRDGTTVTLTSPPRAMCTFVMRQNRPRLKYQNVQRKCLLHIQHSGSSEISLCVHGTSSGGEVRADRGARIVAGRAAVIFARIPPSLRSVIGTECTQGHSRVTPEAASIYQHEREEPFRIAYPPFKCTLKSDITIPFVRRHNKLKDRQQLPGMIMRILYDLYRSSSSASCHHSLRDGSSGNHVNAPVHH
ncbi:hypothetical protein CBL_03399 [Carabus blaptoides fortunei]